MMRFAERLLQIFDVDASLVGDLMERHHRGRSTAWLLRQSVVAAMAACGQAWFAHKMIALRSVAAGGALVLLLRKALWLPMRATNRIFGLTVGNYLLETGHDGLRQSFFGYHLFDLPSVVITSVIFAAAGWLVASAARKHQMPMLLLFAIIALGWSGYGVLEQYADAALVPRMNLYPYMPALEFALLPAAIFSGGLLSRRTTVRPA